MRTYGYKWQKYPEDKTRCIETVYPPHSGWGGFQCSRKRGYGKDGLYCKQHAKKHEAERGNK